MTHGFASLENRPRTRHPDLRACLLVCRVLLGVVVFSDGVFAGDVARPFGSTLLGHGGHSRPVTVPIRLAP